MSSAVPPSNFPFALPNGTSLLKGYFTTQRVLGQGGCGITYSCKDNGLQRTVAVKEYFPAGCARSGQVVERSGVPEFEKSRLAFLEEARTLGRFNHPNIVKVFTTFEDNGTVYMVMENVKGQNLLPLIERQTLTPYQVLAWAKPIADALQTLHDKGMLHRDVKPSNIILSNSGRPVLLDFGIAHPIESNSPYGTRKMASSQVMGSEGYAPPEQYAAHGSRLPASDVYSFGATLYHALTGIVPAASPARATGMPLINPQEVNPHISSDLALALLKALELNISERPPTISLYMETLNNAACLPERKDQQEEPKQLDSVAPQSFLPEWIESQRKAEASESSSPPLTAGMWWQTISEEESV